MKRGKFASNKKGFEIEALGWILLGIAGLVLVILGMLVLKNKGLSAIDYIKSLFGFA